MIKIVFKGKLDYLQSLKEMEDLALNISTNQEEEQIWFVEYDSLYTVGTGENINLETISNVPIFKTNRGGKITYHGPGQVIVYFIVNLKRFFDPNDPDIAKFIYILEDIMLNSLRNIGITASRNSVNHGVWISNNKIGAIGIRLKKWISYHGFALNFNTNLDFYNYITPCGLGADYGVTSVIQEKPDLVIKKNQLTDIIVDEIQKIFS